MDEDLSKLVAIHGQTKVDQGITILDAYIEQNGKRYRNHYAVLNATSWVWDRVRELKAKDPEANSREIYEESLRKRREARERGEVVA